MLEYICRIFSVHFFQFINLSIISALAEGVQNNDAARKEYCSMMRWVAKVSTWMAASCTITKYVKCWLNLVLTLTY